jgi:hypothetical protein
MIDGRLRDIIHALSPSTRTVVQGPTVHRVQRRDEETNWDGSCSFSPDPTGHFAREFERRKNVLRALFKLPEPSDLTGHGPISSLVRASSAWR